MDHRYEESNRGRTRERVYQIDPEFTDLLRNNEPVFHDIETDQYDQYWPKKLKKQKHGCLPNLHLRRLASMFIHTYLIK